MKTKQLELLRAINMLKRALDDGIKVDMYLSLAENLQTIEECLVEEEADYEAHVAVSYHGRDTHLSWRDDNGWEYWEQGELYDSKRDHKVITKIVDSNGKVVQLYTTK